MKKNISLFILLPVFIACICAVNSCSSVSVQAEWKDAKYKSIPFKKIVVIAMFKNLSNRKAVEYKLVSLLRKKGTDAVPGLDFIGPDRIYKYKEMESIFARNKIDGILIISLKTIDTKLKYIEGSEIYVPEMYETPYYNYYSLSYREVYEPGHYEEKDFVFLDCLMYANDTDKLVWMSQLRLVEDYITEDGITDPKRESKNIAHLITGSLKKNHIIN